MHGDVRRGTDLGSKVPTSTSLAECWYFDGAILSRTQLSVRFSPKRTLSWGVLVDLERLLSARSGRLHSHRLLVDLKYQTEPTARSTCTTNPVVNIKGAIIPGS